jgi:hypothetical protein
MSCSRDICGRRGPRRVSGHRHLEAPIFCGNFQTIDRPIAPSIESDRKPQNAREVNSKPSICRGQTAQCFMPRLR